MIGDQIEVTVLAVSGEQVRIGIAAPREIPIFRTEVYDEIHHGEAKAAAGRSARTEVDDALKRMSDDR